MIRGERVRAVSRNIFELVGGDGSREEGGQGKKEEGGRWRDGRRGQMTRWSSRWRERKRKVFLSRVG